MSRLGGVHAPHRKNTASFKAEAIPVPPEVVIPMSMHIGAPAKPVVAAGDEVKVGQLIAEAGGFVSAPIHSSVSGKVSKIDEITGSMGQKMMSIFIKTDGLQTVSESVSPPEVNDFAGFIDAVRASGAVGLGGAGFPTSVKLAVKDLSAVDCIIINGAECEPYITSDTRTMLDDGEYVVKGALLLRQYMNVPRIVFGIEDNKKECIENFRTLTANYDYMEVMPLPSIYPQGGEKVLIYNVMGREVPEGKLPFDVGAIVINCTTLAAIAKYIETGMPLVEKRVTVDGSAVSEPKNVVAPIGTPIKYLIEFCGGYKSEPRKILYGGPMMGIAVPDDEVPVLKGTNAVTVFDERDASVGEESSCIRCGRCVRNCPMHLMPLEIEANFRANKPELLERLHVGVCMECGCCAFGCPAKRPLVQVMKLSKAMLRTYQNEKKAAAEKEASK